jgi:hypothetical protein
LTGKLYFGKTIKKDPITYNGSGQHWSPHVKKHGREYVETLWYCLFHDEEELTKFALMCSEMWNIVKSDEWLNIIPENGTYGFPLTKEQYKARNLKCQGKRLEKIKSDPDLRQHYSDTMADTNRRFTPERNRRLNPIRNQRVHLGAKRSQETRDLMSVSGSGEKNSMFGKVWILNEDLKISKRVSKAEVDSHLTSGWKLGRRMKF